MGLSMEPSVVNAQSSAEWESARAAVAEYLEALRLREPAIRDRLVAQVLAAMEQRDEHEGKGSLAMRAMRELDRQMLDWFAAVLDSPRREDGDAWLSARGRLALLLADVPGRWQAQFLQPAPWPPEFLTAMRESFLHTRPDDHLGHMQPRPIDLGPIATLTRLGHLPYYRILLVWLGFALLLVVVFRLTH